MIANPETDIRWINGAPVDQPGLCYYRKVEDRLEFVTARFENESGSILPHNLLSVRAIAMWLPGEKLWRFIPSKSELDALERSIVG